MTGCGCPEVTLWPWQDIKIQLLTNYNVLIGDRVEGLIASLQPHTAEIIQQLCMLKALFMLSSVQKGSPMNACAFVHAEFTSKGFPNEYLCIFSCWVQFKRVSQWIPVHLFMLNSVQKGSPTNTCALVHAEFSSKGFLSEYICTCSCWVQFRKVPQWIRVYLFMLSYFKRVSQWIPVHLFMLNSVQKGSPTNTCALVHAESSSKGFPQWIPVHLFMLSSVQKGFPMNTCALVHAEFSSEGFPNEYLCTASGKSNVTV